MAKRWNFQLASFFHAECAEDAAGDELVAGLDRVDAVVGEVQAAVGRELGEGLDFVGPDSVLNFIQNLYPFGAKKLQYLVVSLT